LHEGLSLGREEKLEKQVDLLTNVRRRKSRKGRLNRAGMGEEG
jgi:hypothetical protein